MLHGERHRSLRRSAASHPHMTERIGTVRTPDFQREARRGFTSPRWFGISRGVTVAELLDALWRSYAAATPQAARIHRLLTERGELLRNDHLAFRTFDLSGLAADFGGGIAAKVAPAIGIDALARPFEALGWRPRDRYRAR